MELARIIDAYEALAQIKSSNDLPFQLAWKFSDIMDNLEKHYTRYNDERKKVVIELGESNGDETYQIPKDKLPEFQKKMSEILLHEVEIDIDQTFEIADLIDAKLVISKEVNLGAIKPFILENKAITLDK